MRTLIALGFSGFAVLAACGGGVSDAPPEPVAQDGGTPIMDAALAFDASRDAATTDAAVAQDSGLPVLTAAAIRAKLACKELTNGRYALDSGGAATVPVCGSGPVIYWNADLDVDCDGLMTAVCNKTTDRSYQPQTAATDSNGKYLDASLAQYIVVPGITSRFSYTAAGIRMGSAALVLYGNQISFATVGDVGPQTIIGEASYAVAKKLGINPSPSVGGVDSGVTYIVFPGVANDISTPENQAVVDQRVRALAEAWVRTP
jgi:Fungal chitosanase of glycosyl hydrolase group 75